MNTPSRQGMRCVQWQILVLTSLLVFTSGKSLSQSDLRWHGFSVGSEVPGAFIQKFGQDKHGNLWMFHIHGLLSFDGYTFSDYSIADGMSSNHILDMTAHPDHPDIWIVTTTGINVYHGDTFSIPQVHPIFESTRSHRLHLTASGTLWIGGYDGVYRYDGNAVSRIAGLDDELDGGIRAFAELPDGTIVVGTKGGIYTVEGDSARLHPVVRRVNVQKLAYHQDNLWIVEGAYNLHRLDANGALHRVDLEYESKGSVQHASHMGYFVVGLTAPPIGMEGEMLVVGLEDLRMISGDSVMASIVDYPKEVVKQNFLCAFYDREGLLWASFGHQIFQGSPRIFKHFGCEDGETKCNPYVNSMYYDQKSDRVYMGSFDGIYALEQGWIRQVFEDKRLDGGETYTIHRDKKGDWWFADAVLVTRYSKGAYHHFIEQGSFGQRMCLDIHEANDAMWVAQYGRVTKIAGDSTQSFSGIDLHNKRVLSLDHDKWGVLWAGTTDGVFRMEADTFRRVLRPNSPVIKVICQDSMLWLGTSGAGIAGHLIDVDGNCTLQVEYNRLTGEQFDVINDFVVDEGRLWIGSMGVLYQIDPAKPDQAALRFNRTDGYTPYLKTHDAMVIDDDHTLWMGGFNGISALDLEAVVMDTTRPLMHVSMMHVMKRNREKTKFANPADVKQPISISHLQDNITFDYTGAYFRSPDKTNYYYQLVGNDDEWIGPVKSRSANYTNLRPGNYRFQVKAENGNGFYSDVVTVPFTVSAPFWATWWFYLSCAAIIALIVFQINRYLLDRVRKEEAIKREFNDKLAQVEMEALRSQMNPHFIFNALNSIKHFILTNDKFTASEYLSNFSRLVRKILNNSKSSRISLEDELETLQLYIDMEKMRFPDKFTSEIIVDENVDVIGVTIPPLILQPYVENAIWHGLMHKDGEGVLLLHVRGDDGHILCTIEDNGIGREKASLIKSKSALHKKSFGMQITRARIDMSDSESTVDIEDLMDENDQPLGTRVRILIPIQRNT